MSLAVLVIAASASALSAQRSERTEQWSGWAQCRVAIQGSGYSNQQLHTWTITGPAPPGDIADYPGTWTVTGEGKYESNSPNRMLSASWKTSGSAPGLKIGIFVRASDRRRLVLLRHGQLSVPGGTLGSQLFTAAGAKAAVQQPINRAADEWRPFPTIQYEGAVTRMTGSTTLEGNGRLDPLQPPDAQQRADCSWDFVQGGSPSPIPGASASIERGPAQPVGPAVTTAAPPAIVRPGTSGAERLVVPVMPAARTIAPGGFTGTGTAIVVAPRTIALAGFTAVGTAAPVAPRTIALSGFTATGTAVPVPPRTIPLAGWTGAGPEPAAGRGRQR